MSEPPQLVLRVAAAYTGAVGFGEVYACQVSSVLAGTFSEGAIQLTVLANDKEKVAFLAAHPSPQQIDLGFTMASRNEPYALAPITGFVDTERTSWQLEYLRDASR